MRTRSASFRSATDETLASSAQRGARRRDADAAGHVEAPENPGLDRIFWWLRAISVGRDRRMRAVVQRVSSARVRVSGRTTGEIARGLLVLVAVGRDDAASDVTYTAGKIREMRVFESEAGKPMDCSVGDVGGSVLVVSQFTLYGDVRKGRRPAFDQAAPADLARALYEDLVRELRTAQLQVATGEFQAMMQVDLVNDGPVTILIDSKRQF